ncbi:serine/threonine protein kinase [Nocardia tenerifensis]|uniref:non-specific serine/threonine protein kinase n=1 Tax=Nocardia tenerifensis TaxID=228006 RepID=A0A318K2U3_9NOCA|nr:serine/threonine-protein kinase [Nocardia tenerifensis]PXX62141.1 serine/threonine protein kinase [Nocardia tenerifensis]
MRVGQWIAGRYRLEERIGTGAHGDVWRATDIELDRAVALKYALPTGGADGKGIRRVRREAALLAKLNHPGIVTVFDLVTEDGEWWLVMEYVPGQSLHELGVLAPGRAAAIGARLADALEAVHAAGVLHRDIKPSNVFVTGEDRPKLGDFGISRAVFADTTVTGTGSFAGTLGYLAPEVAHGTEPTAASDVFSLGATLFAAVEGHSPFGDAGKPMELMRRTANRQVASPRRAGPLAPALSAMLRTDAAKRPSAAGARAMLEEVADRPSVVRQRISGRVIGGLLVGVAVLVAAGVFVWRAVDSPSGRGPTASASIVGDPRTADPCALTDPKAFERFHGSAEQHPEDGNFNRCDILLRPYGGKVDVVIELAKQPQPPTAPIERTGGIGIVRLPPEAESCGRTVLLPGQYSVEVDVRDIGDVRPDLCGIADVATATVVDVASRGPLPRRPEPPPPNSLARLDACALIERAELSGYPGVAADTPEAGFGDWECRWHSTIIKGSLVVRFDRNPPLHAADGRPVTLAGRQAFITPDGDGNNTCVVRVVHRPYVTAASESVVELVLVILTGPQSPQERCDLATTMATFVAQKLPAPE